MPDFDKEKLVVGTDSGELMYFEGGEVRLAERHGELVDS
jgi:hypothetical protein